jgi:ATP-binding cassette, subfamily B, bacterial
MTISATEANNIQQVAWPVARLGEGIELLARRSGFISKSEETVALHNIFSTGPDEGRLDDLIEAVAAQLGVETEPVTATYAETSDLVSKASPAIIALPSEETTTSPRFLLTMRRRWQRIAVLAPDFSVRWLGEQAIYGMLTSPIETQASDQIDALLTEASVSEDRRPRARALLLAQQFGQVQVARCWLLRLSPGTSILTQMRHKRLQLPLIGLIGANLVQQILVVLSWWIIGRSILVNRFDWAWLLAWALVVFTAIPFQLMATWAQSSFSVMTGAVFKQRLLFGTLQLEPDEIRHMGAGQFMSRVMESEAVELLALGGGFSVVVAAIQLVTAVWVLAQGAGGWPHAAVLMAWVGITVVIGWQYFKRSQPWIDVFRRVTNDLVENMVGYRTRLAQQDPSEWHTEEDYFLSRYIDLSELLDNMGIRLNALIPRGWMVLAIAGVALTVATDPGSVTQIAISLGGILLAYQALTSLIGSATSLVGVLEAWQQVRPIFQAAERFKEQNAGDIRVSRQTSTRSSEPTDKRRRLLEGRDLLFRYHPHSPPILNNCRFSIFPGDRLLLEGPSGGGKSTLAAVLAGLRTADAGLLLLDGVDQQTMGDVPWRRRVVIAPQFHENHILTETFSFNLLMGRGWPPQPGDLEEAESICRELGLGELLDRMPSGFQQIIGEHGWQLSHGERSRLFIARTLLQRSDLIILDESFAALDPDNLHRALECVLRRAPTLLVIAHP